MQITKHRGQQADESNPQSAPPALAGPLVNAGGRLRNPKCNGFTLIETVITLVVLSIAAVGVLSVFTIGSKGSADPLLTSQATQLAQEKMDEIMGDRGNPARGFNWITAAVNPYAAETPVTGFPAFNRSVAIDCVSPPPPPAALNTPTGAPPCASGYAHITVTVTNTIVGSITVETLITNY